MLGDLLLDVRVLKNAPSVEWKKERFDALSASVRDKCVIFPTEQRVFPTEGRNRLAKDSKADAFLFLDDDSYLLELGGILKGPESSSATIRQVQSPMHGAMKTGR